jgi:hypothetical protein
MFALEQALAAASGEINESQRIAIQQSEVARMGYAWALNVNIPGEDGDADTNRPGMTKMGFVYDARLAGIGPTARAEAGSSSAAAAMPMGAFDSVPTAWSAHLHNGCAALADVFDPDHLAKEINVHDVHDIVSRLVVLARECHEAGIQVPINEDQYLGLCSIAPESIEKHPMPPPIIDSTVARIALFGDSSMMPTARDAHGKVESRDPHGSLRTSHFYNVRGKHVWAGGVVELLEAVNDDLSASETPLRSAESEYYRNANGKPIVGSTWDLNDPLRKWWGLTLDTPSHKVGIREAWECDINSSLEDRPMELGRDVAIVFYSGYADFVDDMGLVRNPDEAMPVYLQDKFFDLGSALRRYPRAIVVVGNDQTGLGMGAGIRPWWEKVRRLLRSSGVPVIDGSYLLREIERGSNGFNPIRGDAFQSSYADVIRRLIHFVNFCCWPLDFVACGDAKACDGICRQRKLWIRDGEDRTHHPEGGVPAGTVPHRGDAPIGGRICRRQRPTIGDWRGIRSELGDAATQGADGALLTGEGRIASQRLLVGRGAERCDRWDGTTSRGAHIGSSVKELLSWLCQISAPGDGHAEETCAIAGIQPTGVFAWLPARYSPFISGIRGPRLPGTSLDRRGVPVRTGADPAAQAVQQDPGGSAGDAQDGDTSAGGHGEAAGRPATRAVGRGERLPSRTE